jgi:hypothetical protein
MEIFNDVAYNHAKIQCEILCIVGYIKMIKSDKIWGFKNMHTRIHMFVSLVYLRTKCI